MSAPYRKVTRREPWQDRCDKCRCLLGTPFYYGPHKEHRTVCERCGDVWMVKRQLAIEMNMPDPVDPRYA